MRFEALELIRYGHFDGTTLEFRKSGNTEKSCDLQIVYGPNEAGKSTVREAISDLLFRVPMRSKMTFAAKGVLKVGARAEISGTAIELYRLKKNKDDLVDGEDRPIAPNPLAAVTAGFDRERFEQSFSVSRQQLEDGGNAIVEGKGDLGAMLFAGVSGLQDVPKKLAEIDSRAANIWRGRGFSIVGDLLDRIKDIDRAVREHQTTQAAYDTKRREVDRLNKAFEEAKRTYTSLSGELDAVSKRIAAFKPYRDRLRALNDLEAVGKGPCAEEDDRDRLDDVARELAGVEARLGDARTTEEMLRKRLEGLAVADPITDHDNAIEDLAKIVAKIRDQRHDIPNRQAEADEASATIRMVLNDLGLKEISETHDLSLTSRLSADLSDLLSRHAELRSERKTAAEEVDAAAERLVDAEAALAGRGETPDPGFLRAVLESAEDRDLVAEHRDVARDIAQVEEKIENLSGVFGLDIGSAERLLEMILPGQDELDELETRLSHKSAEVARISGVLDQRREAMAAAEDTLKSLGDISQLSDETLLLAVAARDALISSISGDIKAGLADQIRTGITEAVAETDAIFEQRIRGADRLSEITVAERNRKREAAAVERAAIELSMARAATEELKEKIGKLVPEGVTASGIDGLRKLAEVREQVRTLLTALAAHMRRSDEIAAAGDEQLELIQAALADLNRPPPVGTKLQVLRKLAGGHLAELDEARRNKAAARAREDEAERDLARRRDRLEQIDAEIEAWWTTFREALARTWIPAGTDAALVSAILSRLPELSETRANLQTAWRRIERMGEDATAAEERVRDFLATAAIGGGEESLDLRETDFVLVVDRLSRRLENAQARDSQEREIRSQLRELQEQIEILSSAAGQERAKVADLVEKYAISDFSELRSLIADGVMRQAHQDAVAGFERDMMEALSATSVEEAIELLDNSAEDELKARSGELSADQQKAIEAQTEAGRAAAVVEQEFSSMTGSDAVARLLQEREVLKADLVERVQEYMLLRAGEKTFNWALTRYRQANKAPMLEAAGRFFARMTEGRYPELITQPGDKGDELVAREEGVGLKRVEEMSEGTAHQLFLALRMAGYLEIARGRQAPPLILDDILSSSDDERTKAILRALADLAEEAQVIVLTHHAHVLELARDAVEGRCSFAKIGVE